MMRKRKLGQKPHRQPIPPFSEGPEWEARRSQRLGTTEILRTGRTPLQVIAVAEQASVIADQGMQAALIQHPPRPGLACAEGCAWCCHKVVGCAVPEVLCIAAYFYTKEIVERGQCLKRRDCGRWAAGHSILAGITSTIDFKPHV